MDRFFFADGTDICVYEDGKVKKFPSKFIENYKQNTLGIERANSWKHSGEGAQFRGDARLGSDDNISFREYINGVYATSDDSEAVYSFTINQTSGIYKKRLDDEKADEEHIINSLDMDFGAGWLDSASNHLVISIKRNYSNSDIAVFDLKTGDYKTVTEGDTLDEDPSISPDDGSKIYFSSRGVGRNMNGEFVEYSPASVCMLDLNALDVKEIKSSSSFSYVKPVSFGGKVYAIKMPAKEKRPNPLLEIILIPFRIIQAIANFINVFVKAFTGKGLASGGNNPAKGRDYDSRKEYVKGNLINVEKEMKKNKKRGEDYGFIPQSWQLVELESEKVIKSGVADFDILPDGTFITTNGKHIFAVKDGKSKKLCDAESCLKLSCRHSSEKNTGLFI